jgi:hypothetical protein
MCDHRNPERGPRFQVGNDRKMNTDIEYETCSKEELRIYPIKYGVITNDVRNYISLLVRK